MGRKSTKENKNIYFQTRVDLGLTRAEASELMPGYSESIIEKIENERTPIEPEDVVAMSQAYKKPELCNHYCSHECPIGRDTVSDININNLSEIVLGILSATNAFESKKNLLIDISVDGDISEGELKDYVIIQNQLNKMSASINAFKLWIDKKIASGNIDKDELERIRNTLSK